MSSPFKLHLPFKPRGDQPKAIKELVEGVRRGERFQTLLGVTGSGKTFTIANVIAQVGLPTLVISHNKTLAAQLYGEFKEFFPENAVEYFVSYYDYYQPEAYMPELDTYIEKDASRNDYIDMLRHSATTSLITRKDVIIVASVSCIYGIGEPAYYDSLHVTVMEGDELDRDSFLMNLSDMQYERGYDLSRGKFRVRGDTVEVFPSHEEHVAYRIEFFGDLVERVSEIDPVSGKVLRGRRWVSIFPASHYVTPRDALRSAIESIRKELAERLRELRSQGKLLYAERLEERTLFDLEMLEQTGYCKGIENYSRHLSGRRPGEPPPTLLDYFPDDFLMIIDESHVTIPQLQAMYKGDRSRKETLVEYGFRLPSALDNRPLKFEEFEKYMKRVIFVSATPGKYETKRGPVVEQIIRPTGLMDPEIVVKPATNQVDDLIGEIKKTVSMGDRVLVTTLTKRMAEDLTSYLQELGIRARYLHSEIDTMDRVEIIRDLRLGRFDVLVGVNLLREGLDIPEVSLVAVMDADKEGFLRSETSLIQVAGRAARNLRGRVIFYGDTITESMRRAIEETERRRRIQREYNEKMGITPESVVKGVRESLFPEEIYDYYTVDLEQPGEGEAKEELAEKLWEEMERASRELRFEEAARIRDKLIELGSKKVKEVFARG